ncbi:hypothetical protein ACFSC6_15790 [Rufibacter sediminis]|uniref:DUF4595 domain-containing protein n=1 Tax=Rufibacter sediminis TaxID=2762756 RepID=A0ABR6VWG8_9BACT|nr:hypothetical protein [Rufibacter sediminis]MBC3541498.1 hypothetical protein [Rufibacter sediminis]
MKFIKLPTIFFALSLLVFASCSEDDESDPTPIASDCRITKITGTEGTSTFTYANDRIASFTDEELGQITVTYGSNGQPTALEFPEGSIEYVYEDGNTSKLPDGMYMQSEDISGEAGVEGAAMLITYEYNSAKKVISAERFVVMPSEEPEGSPLVLPMGTAKFEYDSKGNVISEKEFLPNATTPSSTTTYTYDDKKNMAASFQSLLTGLFIAPPSTNNVLTAEAKTGSTVNQEESYTNTYEYNSSGYPTKITSKTKSGTTTVSNVEYACQ